MIIILYLFYIVIYLFYIVIYCYIWLASFTQMCIWQYLTIKCADRTTANPFPYNKCYVDSHAQVYRDPKRKTKWIDVSKSNAKPRFLGG